jgi:hypothetical protein
MKSEKEVINQIKLLKEIKPDAEWVYLAKARIMGHEVIGQRQSLTGLISNFVFQYKVAFAGMLLVGIVGGTMVAAQGALPGEPLYALKRVAEKGYAVVTGQNDTPIANLHLAAKRLEEINLMSQRNLAKNLSAAFYEYKSAKAEAKKEVAALVRKNPSKAGEIVKEAGSAMKEIDSQERAVYGVLGLEQTASSTADGSEAVSDKVIIESLIDYFKKNTTLSEDQSKDLEQVKALYDSENYGQAVDYYLNSSLNK